MNLVARTLITAAALLAFPAAASAADLYVQQGSGATTCAQDDPCDLPQAITVANIIQARDTIHVVGSYTHSGAIDLSQSPIDLVGTGHGTNIDVGAASLVVGDQSSISSLRVVGSLTVVRLKRGGSISDTDVISGTYGIYEEGTSDRATVIDDHTTVEGGTDVAVRIAPGAGETQLTDVHLIADTAILDEGADPDAGSFRLERGNLVGYTSAINVKGTRPTVANTVIATGSGGSAVYAHDGAGVTVDQSTFKGAGGDGILTEGARSHVDVS